MPKAPVTLDLGLTCVFLLKNLLFWSDPAFLLAFVGSISSSGSLGDGERETGGRLRFLPLSEVLCFRLFGPDSGSGSESGERLGDSGVGSRCTPKVLPLPGFLFLRPREWEVDLKESRSSEPESLRLVMVEVADRVSTP